jgi:hypothetical protein
MATFTRSQKLLASAAAGTLGGATLLTVLAGNVFTIADASATAADISPAFGLVDFPICHKPTASGLPNVMLRLAQTEVPRAEMSAVRPTQAFADTEPPMWTGLGSINYKTTTANERAQAYFDQGLRLAYAFNHGEAQRAFRTSQKLDPDCAMCFWGEALVLGPNINLPMQEDAIAPAFAAAQKAKALAAKAGPREQALIAALAVRYGSDPKAPRAPFDAAYAAEMAKVAAQFPDDDEIATLYAEAVMDLSPWNYWKPGGQEPNPQSTPIVPTLERVLARNPDHPGATPSTRDPKRTAGRADHCDGGELQRFDICNSLRSPTHVLARSASAWLAAAVLPRALYNSASPKYDQALAGARASARRNCCSASSKRPPCNRAAARDCRIG